MNDKNNNYIINLLPDIPEGEDYFAVHSKLANHLYNIINSNANAHPLIIGLFGNWGSGKTFIVNKLKEIIKCKDKMIYFYIDIWKYNESTLLRSILLQVDEILKTLPVNKSNQFCDGYKDKEGSNLIDILYKNIEKEYTTYFWESIAQTWKENKHIYKFIKTSIINNKRTSIIIVFMIILMMIPVFDYYCIYKYSTNIYNILKSSYSLLKMFISIILGIDLLPKAILKKVIAPQTIKMTSIPTFSGEQFESILKDMERRLNEDKDGYKYKLIFIFDNIDRCSPEDSYRILSDIKTYMDVPNSIYIIPCDDDNLKRSMNLKCNNSTSDIKDTEYNNYNTEFLEKIFQSYIRIPPLPHFDRDEFIMSKLKSLDLPEIDTEAITNIRQIMYYGYKGETPRNIIKFINDFTIYYTYMYNDLKMRTQLLNNINMFAIITVIRQKWPEIFNIYAKYPDRLVSKEDKINSTNPEYGVFRNNVDIYIRDIDILTFIYLQDINIVSDIENSLRDGIINYELSDKNISITSNYIKYLINNYQDSYVDNTLNAVTESMDDVLNLDASKKRIIIQDYWNLLLECTTKHAQQKDQNTTYIKIVLRILNNKIIFKNLLKTIDYYPGKKEHIEGFFIGIISSNELKFENDELKETFDIYQSGKYHKFANSSFHVMFNYNNQNVNKLYNIIIEKELYQYIPDSMVMGYINFIDYKDINKTTDSIKKLKEIKLGDKNGRFAHLKHDVARRFIELYNKIRNHQGNLNNRDTFILLKELFMMLNYADIKDIVQFNNALNDLLASSKSYFESEFECILVKSFEFIETDNYRNISISWLNQITDRENQLINRLFLRIKENNDIWYSIEKYQDIYSIIIQLGTSKQFDAQNMFLSMPGEYLDQKFNDYIKATLDMNILNKYYVAYKQKNNKDNIKKFQNSHIEKILDLLIDGIKINTLNAKKTSEVLSWLDKEQFPLKDKSYKIINISLTLFTLYRDNPIEGLDIMKTLMNIDKILFCENFLKPILTYLDSQVIAHINISNYSNLCDIIPMETINYKELYETLIRIHDNLIKSSFEKEKIFGNRLEDIINNLSNNGKDNIK